MKNLLSGLIFFVLIVISTQAQVSIITNTSSPEMKLDGIKLSNIFSLVITKWENGNKITLFDNSNGDARTKFYNFISKDPITIKKEWLKKQLMGEGKAPEVLGSDSEVISKVASTPGAIGFVSSSSVNNTVKVLLEIK